MLATEETGKLCRCSAIFVGNYKRVAVFRKAAHNGSAYAVRPAHDKRNSRGESSAGGKSSARGVPGTGGCASPG